MANFEDDRDKVFNDIFTELGIQTKPTIAKNDKPQGLKQLFVKLERLRKLELSRWWDATTLKKYIEIKQVPRGLRVIIFPTFEDLDPDLLVEWENLILGSSFGMMDILIRHAECKRAKFYQ